MKQAIVLAPALALFLACGPGEMEEPVGVSEAPPEPERARATLRVVYLAEPPELRLEEPDDHMAMWVQPGEVARFGVELVCSDSEDGDCGELADRFRFRVTGLRTDAVRSLLFDNLIRAEDPRVQGLYAGLGMSGYAARPEGAVEAARAVEELASTADAYAGHPDGWSAQGASAYPWVERPATPFAEWLEGGPETWLGAGEQARALVWPEESGRAVGPLFYKFAWEVEGPEGTSAVLDPHIYLHGGRAP